MIIHGDALSALKTLPDESVNCCVTSPPYYNLRNYGVEGQIGLEETPEEYIKRLVEVFREVRRVLTKDGTLWLNIGDSYAGSGKGASNYPENAKKYKQGTNRGSVGSYLSKTVGCKPKDLIGIPWMLAFALRADGWYLRNDIIWNKPNVMPESVRDRCTCCHEHIFLLSKSRKYYFDKQSIEEPASPDGRKDTIFKGSGKYRKDPLVPGQRPQSHHIQGRPHERWRTNAKGEHVRNKRDVWTISTQPYRGSHFATFPPKLIEPCILAGCPEKGVVLDPFAGSGTTGMVAKQHGRDFILIELNEEYVKLCEERTSDIQLKIEF